jgi:glyoxylase-like metal-dependent hydrolase (beta-lactamase superfamily II)
VYDAQSRGIFAGDTFGLSYRELDTRQGPFILPTSTPVQFEPEAWHASLERLLELRPVWIYLTHFGRVAQPRRLAAELHRGLDDFVAIACQAEADGRSQRIKTALHAWVLGKLSAHGCQLSAHQIELLLDMDLELNAQGLEIWLKRQARSNPGT